MNHAAQAHSAHQETVKTLSHEGIGDGTPQERGEKVGFGAYVAENVARSTNPGVQKMFDLWMESPGK